VKDVSEMTYFWLYCHALIVFNFWHVMYPTTYESVFVVCLRYFREGCESSVAVLLMTTLVGAQKNHSTESHECLDWLLQLMGLIKNFVTGRQSASDDMAPEVCCIYL